MENKLSEEIALEQWQQFLDYYGIELDDMGDAEKAAFKSASNRIVRAIRQGRVEILSGDQAGSVKQTLSNPPGKISELVYKELTGRAKLAMSKCAAEDHNGRIYALLGSLCGHGSDAIAALRGVDLSTSECIGAAFLSV